jgi:hemerythrin-like domain-containing protein
MASESRSTDPFRAEHVEIRKHLEHIRGWAGELVKQPLNEQKATMKRTVSFFLEHIRPHAEWEERNLYPIVDRIAGGEHFTATMRHEHKIVARWVGELAVEAVKPSPDALAFARRTDNLLGLLDAHFEEEEEVLLPLLDRTLSASEFERVIHSHLTHE